MGRLSFSYDNVLDKAKIASFDIGLIRSSHRKSGGPRTSFEAFSAQGKGEAETTGSRVRKSLKMLELSEIPVVYKDQQRHELDQIRKKITHA